MEKNINFYKNELLEFIKNKIERYFIRTFNYKASLFKYVKNKMLTDDNYKSFYLKFENEIEEELRIIDFNFDNINSDFKYGIGDISTFLNKYYKSPIFIHGNKNRVIIVNNKLEESDGLDETKSTYTFHKLLRNGNTNIPTNNKISQGNKQIAIFEKSGINYEFVGYYKLFSETEDLFIFKLGKLNGNEKNQNESQLKKDIDVSNSNNIHDEILIEEFAENTNDSEIVNQKNKEYNQFSDKISDDLVSDKKSENGLYKLQKKILNKLGENINVTYEEYKQILKKHDKSELKKVLYDVLTDYYFSALIKGKYYSELLESRNYEEITLVPIKPWEKLNSDERLDFSNFLFIKKSLAKLFKEGYFTFSDNGNIILSEYLINNYYSQFLKLKVNMFGNRKRYFKYHRDNIFDVDK